MSGEGFPPIGFVELPPYIARGTKKPVEILKRTAEGQRAGPSARAAAPDQLAFGAIPRQGVELGKAHGRRLVRNSSSIFIVTVRRYSAVERTSLMGKISSAIFDF